MLGKKIQLFLILFGLFLMTRYGYNNSIIYYSAFFIFAFALCDFILSLNNYENMTSNEAIQNIAGIYNADTMSVKNLQVTGDLTVLGNTNTKNQYVSGTINTNSINSDTINGKTISASNRLIGYNIPKEDQWKCVTTDQNGDKYIGVKMSGGKVYCASPNATGCWWDPMDQCTRNINRINANDPNFMSILRPADISANQNTQGDIAYIAKQQLT